MCSFKIELASGRRSMMIDRLFIFRLGAHGLLCFFHHRYMYYPFSNKLTIWARTKKEWKTNDSSMGSFVLRVFIIQLIKMEIPYWKWILLFTIPKVTQSIESQTRLMFSLIEWAALIFFETLSSKISQRSGLFQKIPWLFPSPDEIPRHLRFSILVNTVIQRKI